MYSQARRRATAKWKAKNPQKVEEYRIRGYTKNLRNILLASARKRAKQKELPFDLSLGDIQIPERCPALGVILDITEEGMGREWPRGPRPYAPSLDRIKPELGYVRGNVQIISWRANRIKADATPEELTLISNFMSRR